MYSYDDETRHVIAFDKFQSSKKYKEQIVQEIIAAVCAMLNSNGGKVVIDIESDDNDMPLISSHMSLLIRILEQSMITIIGIHQTVSNISFQEDNEGIVIVVKNADSLMTTNYHLYLPSQSQVVHVPPLVPSKKVKDEIINRKNIQEPVLLASHWRIFCKEEICRFHESKTVQLKNLEAHATKRTTLADRMIGKGNKFTCYVSAFANFRGGHVYYGVTHEGVVEGERIPTEYKSDITKKLQKAINKMIWPEHIGQPKRGEHWDIFFEPVVDEDNKPIPSTFVIVIYIAPCLGGVFTEEPECYEMVEKKIRKMSFKTWKERILQPIELSYVDDISSRFKRVTWSSTRIRNICVFADHVLTQSVNNGESVAHISNTLEQTFPNHKVEVKLLLFSKQVMVNYRSKQFKKAQALLHIYNEFQKKSTEYEIFDAIRVYLQTALHRAEGDVEALSDIIPHAIEKAKRIAPGIISAAIYLLVATVKNLVKTKDDDVDKLQGNCKTVVDFSARALEDLKDVTDSPVVKADMERKSHITSALYYLGCDITGKLTSKDIHNESLEKANSSIMAVKKSINDNPLNHYRDLQFNIANSVLCYRRSQILLDKRLPLLQEAFNFAKRAESVATKYNFAEMLDWARACMALYTESLLRTTRFEHLSKAKLEG